jgi:saccharopepsin
MMGLYAAEFFVGSSMQPITLMIDTGSSWLWVASDNCTDYRTDSECNEHAFHSSLSRTINITPEDHVIRYGTLQVEGKVANDRVGFGHFIVEQMPFIQVNYSIYNSLFGIIGLAPADESSGPLFVMELFNSGQIDHAQFAIQIAPNE